jgi:hypothetical protein
MGWRWPFIIFMFEVGMFFCRTNVLTLILSAIGTYHISGVLYIAWLSLNWAAFAVSLIFHGPFLVNTARMFYADSETRRRAFYESILRLWILYFLIDIWVVASVTPEVVAYCEALSVMEDLPEYSNNLIKPGAQYFRKFLNQLGNAISLRNTIGETST